ncbi:MAG TPA: hypothetical protein VFM88_17625, partial [Vicinamibacteria bacterium]|nr:hypothetical protein [Vicinamibacteria bacterium]
MRAGDLAAAAALAVAPFAASFAPTRAAAELKLGPNAGAYLEGFEPRYEIEGLLATRWAGKDAAVALPLVASGPIEVSFRAARVLRSAEIAVEMGGRVLDRFEARGGVFFVRRAGLDAPAGTPVRVRFVTTSEEEGPRGLRFDWIRIAPGPGGRLRPETARLAAAALLLASLFALFRWAGHGTQAAGLLVLPAALAALAAIHLDPLAFAHVVGRLSLPGLALLTPATLLLRRQPGGRWALAALALAFLGRGAPLVHPASYYPDFGNARRFIVALGETEGSLAERAVAAQEKTNVGYPRIVAGKAYAFPYSPLFFLPSLWPREPDRIESLYRLAGLVPASLEVLGIFLIARLAFPRSTLVPAVAPLLAAFLPPLMSRLLLAMTVTLWGHLADVLLVAATLAYFIRPVLGRLALVFVAALLSQLLYVSSLFTVAAFLLAAAAVERKHAWRLLLVLGASSAITVLWLYHPFLRAFFGEILPAVAGGARMEGSVGTRGGLALTLSRIPLFYGWAWPLLSLAGLALARARGERVAAAALTAYALAFALLAALRGLGGGLFRDLKEIE